MWNQFNKAPFWDLSFQRNLMDSECADYCKLLMLLQKACVQPLVMDRRIWRWEPGGIFSFKSAIMLMYTGSIKGSWAKKAWNKHQSLKNFYVKNSNKVPTGDQLIQISGELTCIFCGTFLESTWHIFLYYEIIQYIWKTLFKLTGGTWVPKDDMTSLLHSQAKLNPLGKNNTCGIIVFQLCCGLFGVSIIRKFLKMISILLLLIQIDAFA